MSNEPTAAEKRLARALEGVPYYKVAIMQMHCGDRTNSPCSTMEMELAASVGFERLLAIRKESP